MGLKYICPSCGSEATTFLRIGEETQCSHCENRIVIPASAKETGVALESLKKERTVKSPSPEKASESPKQKVPFSIVVLRVVAWLELVAGVLLCIFIWIGVLETGLPKITVGIAIFINGIFGWALLIVLAQIALDIRIIRATR